MRKLSFMLIFVVLLAAYPSLAQDEEPVPTRIELTAEDDAVLVGDFYATAEADGEKPAVLLLHMLNSSRAAWATLIPPLLADGYNVLAVDLRGHGETGGSRDWVKAQTDTQAWLGWLREQATVKDDSVSIIGASVGTTLALAGCAADETCVTAIALSPVTWPSIPSQEAIEDGLKERSALLIASQTDYGSSSTLKTLVGVAKGEVNAYLLTGSIHGSDYINPHNDRTRDPVIKLIIEWLDAHQPQVES
jgi:pimeloyl-ACP methyl ester carboxylesterase